MEVDVPDTNPRPLFTRFAQATAHLAGRPIAFVIAGAIVVAWAASGPLFGFSDTWQLVINTSTTIVTFLMVFLIQNTQNRDSQAVQIKLDEIIRVMEGADTALLDLEELEDCELQRIRAAYEELAAKARREQRAGRGGAEAESPANRMRTGAQDSSRDGDSAGDRPARKGPLLALLLITLLPALGCASTESGIRIGDETLDQLEAGKTRESWLLAILGEPTQRAVVADEPGVTVFRYATLQATDTGFLSALLGMPTEQNVATIYFVLRDGIVERFWADRMEEGGLFDFGGDGKSGEKKD
jgi:low affinity Fe/Cu permease